MATKKRRGKGRVVDKWKLKKWYTILTPKVFGMKEVGEIVSADPKNLVNRVIPVVLSQLIGRTSQQSMFTSVNLRVTDVKGDRANTKVIGISISNSYVRTFARKGRSTLDIIYKTKLKDGIEAVLKTFIVTGSRVSENTKRNLRTAVRSYIDKYSKEHNYDDLVNDIVNEKFVSDLYGELKKITSLKKAEIKKMELVENFE